MQQHSDLLDVPQGKQAFGAFGANLRHQHNHSI